MRQQVKNTNSLSNKLRARVVTVHPETRRIEAGIKDGMVQVSVTETGPFFRWPKQGEMWSIFKEGHTWKLGNLLEEPGNTTVHIEDLIPGEAKISADTIVTDSGKILATLDDIVSSSGGVNKFTATIGDGTSTTYRVAHPLGTTDVDVDFRLVLTGESFETDWYTLDTTAVFVSTRTAPSLDSIRVTIWG